MINDNQKLRTVINIKVSKYDVGMIPGKDSPFEVEEKVIYPTHSKEGDDLHVNN